MSEPLSDGDRHILWFLLSPLSAGLNNQAGGEYVEAKILAAHLRRLRRFVQPPSPRLQAISKCNARPETEAERRALRALEYPEPITPRRGGR
jgi:hypothetical protein